MLHRDGQRRGLGHGADATGHLLGLGHQAGPKAPLLDLLAGTADVEVDLVVAAVGGDARGFSQQNGIVAPHLQGNGVLDRVEVDQPVPPLAVVEGLGHHHFGVEQAATADLPHQHPEVPIGVVHHRSHTEAVGPVQQRIGHHPMLAFHADAPPF